jgi:multidrug transporter EmrE-like cation transporter
MKKEFVDISFFSLNFNSKLFPMSIFYEEWIKTEAQITSIFIFLFFGEETNINKFFFHNFISIYTIYKA